MCRPATSVMTVFRTWAAPPWCDSLNLGHTCHSRIAARSATRFTLSRHGHTGHRPHRLLIRSEHITLIRAAVKLAHS
ncbi:uncharacterized protein C8Q71DRAFT_560145 [Rhodofomes roseus]|uniref:Secreted protein n=1 Tax=Rhodofomes roseus TaxID=34475 RepID=A0ABQ8KIG4_9APHY|nr:uncharacterized protein C8Q71DRAFT_560145 [Rhodofomes roseus]KAH9837763.1 hypothetical protein C8Q71DRAFT_560145 [Rhodofomes roseus]